MRPMNLKDALDDFLVTIDNHYLNYRKRLVRKFRKLTCEVCGNRNWNMGRRWRQGIWNCRHCGAVYYLGTNRLVEYVLIRSGYLQGRKG